ncbi:arylsulfatase [Chryseolinea sp. T2]|uniref:arylsulfatase n=1 Tax=Chryseolinea sp. T2 TaxID=3129255 RepID=UPI003077CBE9
MNSRYISAICMISIALNASAQHSPRQDWKGKTGNTLRESIPYHINYNKEASEGAPNVLWILIDDAGFGATSAFGGLVETPNIEKIANRGIRFTNFHTTAICSPTRAALLTGRNHHSVHVGLLTPAAIDFPGYDTRMPFEKATVAEILRENGYNTFALGKWHLTPVTENGPSGPFNRWPTGRGFDHFYGFHPGATDQWHPELWEDQTKLDIEPNKKHVNELLADKAIKYIANQKSGDPNKPFFLYFAPGATHSPHQVSKEWIAKYKGKFDMGWDKYREQVIDRQRKAGIIPANAVLPERNPNVKEWATLSEKEKKVYAHFMEVYAAFYSYTDYEIGRIANYLDLIGQLDNTLIVLVLGDNGASKGGGVNGAADIDNQLKGEARIDALLKVHADPELDQSVNNDYPIGWAMACNTPFRYWKTDANSEGGTRNPMILSYPKVIAARGEVRHQYGHVIDVLPTTLELVNGLVPQAINGYKQEPIEGTSLAYTVKDKNVASRHTTQYYEIAGARSIYKDGWKASTAHAIDGNRGGGGVNIAASEVAPDGSKVDFSQDVWELYNLNDDFNERNNLAAKFPEKLNELQAVFDVEARKYNVYPLKDFTAHDMPAGRTIYGKSPVVTLFPGVDNLVGVNSPLYDGRSFLVTTEVDLRGDEQGVLFAIGGESSGISLFIKDGILQLAHKVNGTIAHLESVERIKAGKQTIELQYYLSPNEGFAGTELLRINGTKVGERKIPKGQASITNNNLIDGTDVGRDQRVAVSDRYTVPFAFTGKLRKVTITYAKPSLPAGTN